MVPQVPPAPSHGVKSKNILNHRHRVQVAVITPRPTGDTARIVNNHPFNGRVVINFLNLTPDFDACAEIGFITAGHRGRTGATALGAPSRQLSQGRGLPSTPR